MSTLTLVEALSRALTTTQVAEAVFRHVLPAIGAAAGTLVLRADERDALELVGAVGHSQATLEAFRRIPLDASTPAAEVIRTRRPLWIGSLAVSGADFPYFAERSTGHRALAVLPLALEDEVTGALALAFVEERTFEPAERTLLVAVAAQCAAALQRAAAFARERTSRERLEVALDAAKMGTWDWDLRSGRLTWSPQLEAIHGFEPGAFGSTLDAYLAHVDPRDVERVREGIAAALGGGELHLEYRAVWPNGSLHWYEARGRLVGDAAGEPTALRGVCMDVSARRQAEQERERLLGSAQAARELAEAAGRRLALQYELAELLAAAAPEATPAVLPVVCRGLGWDWGALWRLDFDAAELRCAEVCQVSPGTFDTFESASRQLTFARGAGLIGRVWATGEPIWVPDATRERGFTRAAAADQAGLRGAVALPLRVGGEVVGVLEFLGREGRPRDPAMLTTLVGVGDQLGQFLERRRAEETLRRQAALLELAPVAVTTRDTRSRITYWNRAAEELYGWTADEARGHLSHDVLGTRFPGSVAEHEARLARDGAWQGELIRRHRDGTELVVASRWALLRDQQGRPEATLEVSTDITAQKRAEEERARLLAAEQAARAEAEAARRRYQDLVQGLDAIVWEADAATFRFTFISQRAEDILGYPVERWLTEPHFWADHIVPDDREWAVNYCASCTNAAEDHEFEYRLQAADGRLVWMRDIVHVVTDAQRRPVLLRGVMVDITERKQAEAERARLYESERTARAAAEAAISARDEFVAVVSHDLRNPLTAVRGHIQMVRRRAARGEIPTAEQLVERLNTIESSVMALSAQIDELQDATRLQSGRPLDLVRRPTDLVAVAREGVQKLQHTSDAHRLGFETAVPALVGTWDAGRLARVIGNLLSNAIKYSPAGGDIKVAVAREADWGVLSVEDHGLGIPAADLPHVFERYRRASNVAGRIAGSGLGLAGARDIVEQHGGTIAVRSVEGRGTTFLLRLPLDHTGLPDGGADPTGGRPATRGGRPGRPDRAPST